MGEEERLNDIADELGLLLDELRSLAANRAAGVHRKCISNLDYASFHAARAVLLAHGLEARTHEGTQRLFAAHFVKTNTFAAGHLKTLARLEADRVSFPGENMDHHDPTAPTTSSKSMVRTADPTDRCQIVGSAVRTGRR